MRKVERKLKLLYYALQRPLFSRLLSAASPLGGIKSKYGVDRILLNEGGTFKEHLYGICNRTYRIEGSSVFVPGCGYGKHLSELAMFRPKVIVACDLYEYAEEWDFLRECIQKKLGVKIIFLNSGINDNAVKEFAPFDWIINDAVLEHVRDLGSFLAQCSALLKESGHFFASFGPLWYGPYGDHIAWGLEGLFNHILLDNKEYEERLNSVQGKNSTEGAFIVRHRLLSYLHAGEYLELLERTGFVKNLLWVKFSTQAWKYFKCYGEREALLSERGCDVFDRYCHGMMIWARKRRKEAS